MLNKAIERYTSISELPDDADRMKAGTLVDNLLRDFYEYYPPKKLYFKPATADKIKDLTNTMQSVLLNYTMTVAMQKQQLKNSHILQDRHAKLDRLKDDMPELLDKLEREFQDILGIPTKTKQ